MKTGSKAPSEKKIRVADYIANFLVEHGIRDIFVLTGYGAMYLNDAIAKHPKLKYYCVRNEATSPMMAEAYARVRQSLGAICVTAGPGAANAVSGLVEAWVDAAPVIILSGQVQRSHTTYNANLAGLRSFGTAEVNIIPVVSHWTKYAQMINDPKLVRYHLEKAVHLATYGRPGPVWLDIPHDVQSAVVEPEKLTRYYPEKIEFETNLDGITNEVVELLKLAKRPLLVAGHGIRQGEAIRDFAQLVNILKIPVLFSRLGIDILPFSHPYNMGLGGIRGVRHNFLITKKADLVLVLGSRLAIPFVGQNLDCFDKKIKIIACDIEADELKKPGVALYLPIHGDVKPFIKKLNSKLLKSTLPSWTNWLKYSQRLKDKYPMVTDKMRRNPIDLYYFMSRLDALAAKKNILVTDSGSNYYIGGQVWRFENGQREITSGTFGAMGLSIPLAIGAAIAKPHGQVLAVSGDGSLELNIQELKTMSYYNLNIKLFVINNGGYVSMRRWQDTYFEGRRIGSDNSTGAEITNLRKVAGAFDLEYEKIENWQEIDFKIRQVMSNKKPIFIEVFCDNAQKIVEPIKPV